MKKKPLIRFLIHGPGQYNDHIETVMSAKSVRDVIKKYKEYWGKKYKINRIDRVYPNPFPGIYYRELKGV